MTTPTINTVQLDPAALSQKDKYKLLIGCIVPRPIAFVSTQSRAGVTNLAPYSFFNGVSSDPPCIMFSVTARTSDGAKKDTLRNIEETGEFVINTVNEEIVAPMNQTSAEYPPDISEFDAAEFTPIPSRRVAPPRVKESPIAMECELYKLVPVGKGGEGSATIVVGEIVYFNIREDVYDNGRILIDKVNPVSRLAGAYYAPVREAFEIPRPTL